MRAYASGLLLSLALPLGAAAQGTSPDAQVGILASAETVTVGDPFRVAVRVRAPLGSTVEFPSGPDSTRAVQLLDPMATPVASPDPSVVDQTASYRVAAWDVDSQRVELGELVVRTPAGVQRFQLVKPVFVRSVLPADSTQHVPKPVRAIFGEAAPSSWLWLVVALALALLALLLWWWLRRRRPAVAAPEDAHARALEEFQRVERLGLIEAGERGRHVALMVEVMRGYLHARVPEAHLSHTSTELLLAMRRQALVPFERLGALLGEADLVKFARRAVSPDRARQLGTEARTIVEAVEEAIRRAAAADAARQAREASARKEAA